MIGMVAGSSDTVKALGLSTVVSAIVGINTDPKYLGKERSLD
jgi:hypothetical protein